MVEGEQTPQRRTHLIRREDVADWVADSVVKRITTHWTSEEHARRIREEGIRIKRSEEDATWGQGFYTTTGFRPDFGDTPVHVAIWAQRPFVAVDRIAALEQIDELLVRAGSEDVRTVLRAAGYDSVVVHWESGEVWVVAFLDDQVKVIEER